jgi:hypothetical protein
MLFAPAMVRALRKFVPCAPRRVTPSERLARNDAPDIERVMPIECGMPERMPTPEYERTLYAGAMCIAPMPPPPKLRIPPPPLNP